MQDVFTKLLEKDAGYDLVDRPEVLLFKMARNRCIDLRRKRTPEAMATLEPVARNERQDDEVATDLAAALATLPFEEREALLLTTVDGLGYREVAAILGCSLGTVASRKYAAIHRLQQRLHR